MISIVKNLVDSQFEFSFFLKSEYSKSENRNSKLINDRRWFYEKFKREAAFILFTRQELNEKPFLLNYVYEREENEVWLKKSESKDGNEIARVFKSDFSQPGLLKWMGKHKYDYLELKVSSSAYVNFYAPKGLSTLNILGWHSNRGKVSFLGAAMQFSVFSELDSFGAGGIWLALDPDFGHSFDQGIQAFPERKKLQSHPLSNRPFKDFKVENIEEVHELIEFCSRKLKLEGLLNWKVVLKDEGPKLMGVSSSSSLYHWLKFGNLKDLAYRVENLLFYIN